MNTSFRHLCQRSHLINSTTVTAENEHQRNPYIYFQGYRNIRILVPPPGKPKRENQILTDTPLITLSLGPVEGNELQRNANSKETKYLIEKKGRVINFLSGLAAIE